MLQQRRDLLAKLGVLTCLYLSQGVPFGFFSQALPAILRNYGVDLKVISLISAFAFPWSLKFLWAPWIDRDGSARIGHRKSWILPLQAIVASLLVAIAMLNPPSLDTAYLVPLVGLLFLVNLAASTQDVATDGLTVTVLNDSERGFGNSIQVSGFRVGMVIGGGGILMLMGRWGWVTSFLGMAALIVAVTIPVLFFREPPHALAQAEREQMRWWAMLRSFVQRPGIVYWLLILLVFKMGDSFGSGMTKPLLVDAGLTLEDVGWVSGIIAMVAAIVGGLVGGWVILNTGRRRALMLLGGLQGISMLGYAWIATAKPSLWIIASIVSLEHFLSSMASVAMYTCMMDVCRKSHAGSDFTLQASLFAGATGLVYLVSGFSADHFGYFIHFIAAAVIALLALLPVYFWRESRVE
mgnify:CR=1 FL=1